MRPAVGQVPVLPRTRTTGRRSSASVTAHTPAASARIISHLVNRSATTMPIPVPALAAAWSMAVRGRRVDT